MGSAGPILGQVGTGVLQGVNQTIAQQQALRNTQQAKLMRLAGSGRFDLQPIADQDEPTFWERLFSLPGQEPLLQLGPQRYRLVPKPEVDTVTALGSLFSPREQVALGLARPITGAPPFAKAPRAGIPATPANPQQLHFTAPTALGKIPLTRQTAVTLIRDRAKRQQAEEAELKKQKLELVKEARKGPLPKGTLVRIRQAQSLDDMATITADLAAAQRAQLAVGDASPSKLALAAAMGNPDAVQALKLLHPDEVRDTLTALARQAAAGNPVAKAAIEILKDIKRTGVRRQRSTEPTPPPFPSMPRTTPTPEGGSQGQGEPRIKSFRRIE